MSKLYLEMRDGFARRDQIPHRKNNIKIVETEIKLIIYILGHSNLISNSSDNHTKNMVASEQNKTISRNEGRICKTG
jgi:hypothetical protein